MKPVDLIVVPDAPWHAAASFALMVWWEEEEEEDGGGGVPVEEGKQDIAELAKHLLLWNSTYAKMMHAQEYGWI